MSQPERPSAHEWVRIGRLAVERWRGRAGAMQLVSRQALPDEAPMSVELLTTALQALMVLPPGTASALIESAWMPVLLADTGGTIWSKAQLDALLTHRLGALYRDVADPVAAWDVRTQHRAGDRWALGFGLPARVRACLSEVAAQAQFEWTAMLPACAWGLAHQRPARSLPGQHGWWLWPEQDRQLLFCVDRDEVRALNAALSIDPHAATSIAAAVAAESLRAGVAGAKPPAVLAATWRALDRLPAPSMNITWLSVAGAAQADAITSAETEAAA